MFILWVGLEPASVFDAEIGIWLARGYLCKVWRGCCGVLFLLLLCVFMGVGCCYQLEVCCLVWFKACCIAVGVCSVLGPGRLFLGSSWVLLFYPLVLFPFLLLAPPFCSVCAGCDAGVCVVRLLFRVFFRRIFLYIASCVPQHHIFSFD